MSKNGFWKKWSLLPFAVVGQYSLTCQLPACILKEMEKMMFACSNAYRVPNLTVRPHMMRTNLPSKTAMRGVGVAEAIIIAEHWISDVAIECGISQTTVRFPLIIKVFDCTWWGHIYHLSRLWGLLTLQRLNTEYVVIKCGILQKSKISYRRMNARRL